MLHAAACCTLLHAAARCCTLLHAAARGLFYAVNAGYFMRLTRVILKRLTNLPVNSSPNPAPLYPDSNLDS